MQGTLRPALGVLDHHTQGKMCQKSTPSGLAPLKATLRHWDKAQQGQSPCLNLEA